MTIPCLLLYFLLDVFHGLVLLLDSLVLLREASG